MATMHTTVGTFVPPTEGKYFFTEMKYVASKSYINLGVGSDKQSINLMLNAEELALALFSTNCHDPAFGFKCDVPNPYNENMDWYVTNQTSTKNISYETAYMYSQE